MTHIDNGQCGLCVHFGEHSKNIPQEVLVRIRKKHEANERLVAECGHPNNSKLNLKVTPTSGCSGFEEAQEVQH